MRYFLTGYILLVVLVVSIAGFRGDKFRRPPLEIFPDMDRQLKVGPQTTSDFFEDGRSSRLPVNHTIARSKGVLVAGREVLPFEDHPVNTGIEGGGSTNFVAHIPVAITSELLARGRERYGISCLPCHGASGDGNGVVKQYGFLTIANLQDPRIVGLSDGELFHIITNGKNTMKGYGSNVSIADRWAIVSYVRALQRSGLGTLEEVPASNRPELQ